MEKGLTEREKRILEAIRKSLKDRGYPPAVREIGESVGLKSSSTVHGYLKRLEEKGVLKRDPTKPRAIELSDDESRALGDAVLVPLLGRVAAGVPLLAVENLDGLLPVPTSYFGQGTLFMLKVKGDSMIGAGINEEDLVVVRQQPEANNGEIVVAMIDDEATVKRFFRENGHVRLQPENPALEPIVTTNVQVLGKVIGLLRKY